MDSFKKTIDQLFSDLQKSNDVERRSIIIQLNAIRKILVQQNENVEYIDDILRQAEIFIKQKEREIKSEKRQIKRNKREALKNIPLNDADLSPFLEMHYPGYNFMGPGTNIKERLLLQLDKSGKVPDFLPVDILDYVAVNHDMFYMTEDPLIRAIGDAWMLDEIKKPEYDVIPQIKLKIVEKAIKTMFAYHIFESNLFYIY
jgi:hypothetical protein